MKVAILCTGESMYQCLVEEIHASGQFDKLICVSDCYKFNFKYDAMVSTDRKWWEVHFKDVMVNHPCVPKYCAQRNDIGLIVPEGVPTSINSGVLAMWVAREVYKASEIHLFGVDLKGTHFFGAHPDELKNTDEATFTIFKAQYELEGKRCAYKKIKVINRNPDSALDCFEKLEWSLK